MLSTTSDAEIEMLAGLHTVMSSHSTQGIATNRGVISTLLRIRITKKSGKRESEG